MSKKVNVKEIPTRKIRYGGVVLRLAVPENDPVVEGLRQAITENSELFIGVSNVSVYPLEVTDPANKNYFIAGECQADDAGAKIRLFAGSIRVAAPSGDSKGVAWQAKKTSIHEGRHAKMVRDMFAGIYCGEEISKKEHEEMADTGRIGRLFPPQKRRTWKEIFKVNKK